MYDITPADDDDRYITLIHAALEGAAQALATGKYIVIDFFPFLKNLPAWFPGAGFQKKFAEWRASGEELKNVPFAYVKDGIVGRVIAFGSGILIRSLYNRSKENIRNASSGRL